MAIGRIIVSAKRSTDPCSMDASTRKKVSKPIDIDHRVDVERGTRSSVQASKNLISCRHECRKGDVEPQIIGEL